MAGPDTSAARAVARTDPEEERLVRGLVSGDRDAVSTFIERTHRAVFVKACRFTPDQELRQDWTHDVLISILDELAAGRFVYRWPGCFWSWFGQRAHFLLLNRYNRHRTQEQRFVTGEEGEHAFAGAAQPESQIPDRLLENVEIRATIERCLDKLASEDHRRVLVLLLFEDMSYEDIATALSRPLNTVRTWIRRGRTSVRHCVARALEIPGPAGKIES